LEDRQAKELEDLRNRHDEEKQKLEQDLQKVTRL
jgi:Skp family chaperone for outer membrane proteins